MHIVMIRPPYTRWYEVHPHLILPFLIARLPKVCLLLALHHWRNKGKGLSLVRDLGFRCESLKG